MPDREPTQVVPRQTAEDCFAQLDAAFEALFPAHVPTPPAPEPARLMPAPGEPSAATADEWKRQVDAACDMLDAELARSAPATPPRSPQLQLQSQPQPQPMSMTAATVPPPQPTPLVARIVPHQPEPTAISTRPLARLELATARAHAPEGHRAIDRLLGVLENLSLVQRDLGTGADGSRGSDESSREVVARILADAHQLCVELDLPTARVRADFALAALDSFEVNRVSQEAGELIRHIRHDLQSCAIWPIAKTRLWSFGLTLDDHVKAAFPSSQPDVAEGGLCFGFGRYTACVFHMLRAADPGLRALARAAGITRTMPRGGDWTALITEIEAAAARIDNWPAGAARSAAQEFFEGAIADAKALADAARKLANGARPFDEQAALSVCDRTTDFLGRLSDRVMEAQRKALVKRDFSR